MSPWVDLRECGDSLLLAYAPPDDSETLPRCDCDMLLVAVRRARHALQAARTGREDEAAIRAVLAFTDALEAVLKGLAADLRDACDGAHELVTDLQRLRGPSPM